ncbi:hypothetical protein BH23DEI1_BH23DEI1_22470 [soil metagenome]
MADPLASAVGTGAVRLERRLPGPIHRVWDHLTDPELRATRLAGGPMEGRVGGRIPRRSLRGVVRGGYDELRAHQWRKPHAK